MDLRGEELSCACACWYVHVQVSACVCKGAPPSLLFRTAFVHCASQLIILPVVVCERACERACVRACLLGNDHVEGEDVVRVLRCVRRGVPVCECVSACEDLPPSLSFRTDSGRSAP